MTSIRRFYDSPAGHMAAWALNRRIAAIWPDTRGLDMLGWGYCAPFSGTFASARRTALFLPDRHAMEVAPDEAPHVAASSGTTGTTVIGAEARLPFRDAVFDRVLVCHGLEDAENPGRLLREVWRVLAPEGRIIVIVPNRTGVWSHFEHTPFGHGRSFTPRQLRALLGAACFAPRASSHALFAPPLAWPVVRHLAPLWEQAGERLWPVLGGVTMTEAVKFVAAPLRGGIPVRAHANPAGWRAKPAAASAPLRARAVDLTGARAITGGTPQPGAPAKP